MKKQYYCPHCDKVYSIDKAVRDEGQSRWKCGVCENDIFIIRDEQDKEVAKRAWKSA